MPKLNDLKITSVEEIRALPDVESEALRIRCGGYSAYSDMLVTGLIYHATYEMVAFTSTKTLP